MADLPDTDDPHALLDVQPDANADEVRRAYLRKIKVFKPDLDPASFRRLRTAYETLAERIALLERLPSPLPTPSTVGWDHDAAAPKEDSRPTARRDRLRELTERVATALADQRRDEAARLLLTREAEVLATEPAFASPLLDVCCATSWSAEPLCEALIARYHDIVVAAGSVHGPFAAHPLWAMQSLRQEKATWLHAAAGIPELTAFIELSGVVRGPVSRALAQQVADKLADDPQAVLAVLDEANTGAPGIVALLRERAEAWTQAHAVPSAATDDSTPTALAIVRQVEAGLTSGGRVGREWLKRLAVTLTGPAIVVAVGGTLTPLLFSFLVGTLAYRFGFDATRTLYANVVRPTLVPWLVVTGQPIEGVAEQLRRQLQSRGAAFALLRPDAPARYPALLLGDAALHSFAAIASLAREQ